MVIFKEIFPNGSKHNLKIICGFAIYDDIPI